MVNNCVNHNNYKSFVLFLAYGFYLCVFGILVLLPHFIKANESIGGPDPFRDGHVFFLFYSSVLFGVATGGLLLYHLYLTAMNQTTVESVRPTRFSYGNDKYGYYLGIRRNFLQVFGSNSLLWFLPVYSSDGDGTAYPLRVREGMEEKVQRSV